MKILEVTLKGITASFREPSSISYQESIVFPPPTSIIGLLGASFGLSFEQAYYIFKNINIGIKVQKKGFMAQDLWKINKIKNKKTEKAIVNREIYFYPEYTVYIQTYEKLLEEIKKNLKTPFYPLTLGRNEEIINEVKVNLINAYESSEGEIENVVLKGKLKPGEFILSDREKRKEVKTFKSYELTQSFEFKNNIRKPWKKKTFTFVDKRGEIKCSMIKIKNENIPLWGCTE